jgi:hypothetical protein
MTPVFLGHARRVDFTTADLETLPIEQEIIRADGECVGRRLGRQVGGEQDDGSKYGEQLRNVHGRMMRSDPICGNDFALSPENFPMNSCGSLLSYGRNKICFAQSIGRRGSSVGTAVFTCLFGA